jgi:arsenate reductase
MAAKTLEQAGFEVLSEGKTVYSIKYGDAHPIIGFSKTYDDSFNPQSAFAAILTCSQADGVPFITGAEKESQSLLKTQKHLIIHPNKKKNIERASKSLRSFSMYSQNKIICPQLIALLP